MKERVGQHLPVVSVAFALLFSDPAPGAPFDAAPFGLLLPGGNGEVRENVLRLYQLESPVSSVR